MPIQDYNLPAPGQGMVNALALRDEAANRRQDNALYAERVGMERERWQAEQGEAQQAQAAALRKQRGAALYPLIKAGDPQALQEAVAMASEVAPIYAEAFQRDPEGVRAAILQGMEREYGGEAPRRNVQQVGNALIEIPEQGDVRELYRAPPQPQQYGPESFSPQTLEDGSIALVGNRGTIRRTDLRGQLKGGDKAAVDAETQQTRNATRANDAQNVRDAIATAKRLVSPMSAGFIGQKIRSQGGTPAFDLNSAINTVKANIGFDRLQRMREESKTGGALGQVAVQELEMLQATIASLDTAQSPQQLLENLDAVDAQYVRAMEAYGAAMTEAGRAAGGTTAERRITASDLPPPAALRKLQEGKVTTFANGEKWTVKAGKAVRVQ